MIGSTDKQIRDGKTMTRSRVLTIDDDPKTGVEIVAELKNYGFSVDWVGVFGRNFSGFSFDKLVPDVGAGLVLHTRSQFLMRVQVAYGIGSGVQTMFATTAGF